MPRMRPKASSAMSSTVLKGHSFISIPSKQLGRNNNHKKLRDSGAS